MPTINKPKRDRQTTKGNNYYAERRKVYQTQRWARLRQAKIIASPLCEMCEKEGRYRPAEDVHHITSFMTTDDPIRRNFLAYDYDNLMSLCKECHQKIHNSYGPKKEG
jgi:5-methylcytosine-specific restriction protein A